MRRVCLCAFRSVVGTKSRRLRRGKSFCLGDVPAGEVQGQGAGETCFEIAFSSSRFSVLLGGEIGFVSFLSSNANNMPNIFFIFGLHCLYPIDIWGDLHRSAH